MDIISSSIKYNSMSFTNIYNLNRDKLIKFPKYQRPIDTDRSKDIYEYIKDNYTKELFIMPSVIMSYRSDDKLYIIDGQHRIKAIIAFVRRCRQKKITINLKLLCLIKENLNIEDEMAIFKIVNLGVPISKRYINVDELKEYYSEVEELFNEKWYEQLSESFSCYMPNNNLTSILNALNDRGIIKQLFETHLINSPKHLVEKIIELNTYVGYTLKSSGADCIYIRRCKTPAQFNALENNIIKCDKYKNPCYLGLLPKTSWIDFICCHKL